MNTFLKRLLARAPGDGMRFLVFLGIVVIVGAVVTDRAISKGNNVTLQVASFLFDDDSSPVLRWTTPKLDTAGLSIT